MTNREFYTAVISADISAELTKHATKAIAKLDAERVKAKEKPSKKAMENAPIKEAICNFLKGRTSAATGSEIATAVEISVNKVSALCRQLAEDGLVVSVDVKIPKVGRRKAYRLVTETDETAEEITEEESSEE